MKIISLNTWGGRVMEPLKDFLKKHNDVDVFCFQEVYHDAHGKDTLWKDGSNFDLLDDLKKAMADYEHLYHPHLGDWWGLAIFIKKGTDVIESGDHFVHKMIGHNPEIEIHGHTAKNIQFVKIINKDKSVTIMNIHGLWNGGGKKDSEDRINQSRKIVEFIKKIDGDWILCGDFNLEPDTESVAIIEKELECQNLIKDHNITSTRTSFYLKPVRLADYAFVSRDLVIKDFKVLPDEVSDHNPLLIEI